MRGAALAESLAGTMNEIEQARENRREAVRESLRATSADEVAARLRRFVEASGGATNEWDQRFVEFIAGHRDTPLWTGTAGGGFEFVFSPRDEAGFWLLEARDGGRGKGFLGRPDAGRIFELAALKGLRA